MQFFKLKFDSSTKNLMSKHICCKVKDMIETTTFFGKSVVKGSCTVVEFRVSLEKK